MTMKGMPRTMGVIALFAVTMAPIAKAADAPGSDAIPAWSESLAKALDPVPGPFLATYRSGSKTLGFVAAEHVFTNDNTTIDAIWRAFLEIDPTAVIIEGYPTAAGINPSDILDSVRKRNAVDADSFSKGEAVFAASRASDRKVPFLGGEPTTTEQMERVVAKGHSQDEAMFALRVSMLGQERRSGQLPIGDATAFTAAYERVSRTVAYMTKTDPLPETQFKADYMKIVGVDAVNDANLLTRTDPGTATLLQRVSANGMRARDEHLLLTISQQLAASDRVLVVYGRGHWTTLSAALRRQFGPPAILAITGAPTK